MKKFAFSVASLAVATALALSFLARPAMAADAHTKFLGMKRAVMGKAQGSRVTVTLSTDGTVVDETGGQFKEGEPITIDVKDGKSTISQKALTPEELAEIQKILDREGGSMGSAAYIDGKPVTLEEVNRILAAAGANIQVEIELNESSYQSIAFGADKDTLVLSPKKLNQRYIVHLDSKTSMPDKVSIETKKDGKWTKIHNAAVTFTTSK